MVRWAIVVTIASILMFAVSLYHKKNRPKMLVMVKEIPEWALYYNMINVS
jgi:hypothetical protein